MKIFLALLPVVCACLIPAQADIVRPNPHMFTVPTVVTVTNLAAFPKYKFSYRPEGRQESTPIHDGQAFSVRTGAQLLIQRGNGPEQPWEHVNVSWRGASVAIKVEAVEEANGTITVTSKTTSGDPNSRKKSAAALPQSLPLFAFSGIAACGLVLLAGRRKVR